jgi:hypothetical protein
MPQDAEPGAVLARRHRRCGSALADFYLLVIEEDTTLTRTETALEMDRLVQRVLEELHAAEATVLDALAGTARSRPAARLLGGRLDRLRRAGIQVGAAVRVGDVLSLRRTMTRFDALARAACAVQLDVYASAVGARRVHRPVPGAAGAPTATVPGPTPASASGATAAMAAVRQGTPAGRSMIG